MLPQASNSVLLHELQQNHTQRDEEQFYPMDVHIDSGKRPGTMIALAEFLIRTGTRLKEKYNPVASRSVLNH